MAGALILVAGIVLLAATSFSAAALMEIRGRAPFFAATLVLAATFVVGEEILLSLVHLLRPAPILATQALLAALMLSLWVRARRPRPPLRPRVERRQLRALVARWPALSILLLVASLALAFQAFMAVAVAPNEADTVNYHLPRADLWLQQHSALQYAPGTLDDPGVSSPPNAELLLTFTMALSKSDRYTQLVQWVALIGLAAAILSLARLLGAALPAAAWAAGLFVVMPAPLLQAATDQNDVVLAFFSASAAFFLARAIRDRSGRDAAVGAASVGLAAGTKLTFFLLLPILAAALAAAVYVWRPGRRFLLRAVALTVAGLVALGAFNYVQNLIHTHNVTGFTGPPGGDFVKQNPAIDAARVAWYLVETPGLPEPRFAQRVARHVVDPLFKGVHGSFFGVPNPPYRDNVGEDESAYGLIGELVLVPLLVWALFRGPPARRIVAGGAILYFLAYTLALGFTPESSRYLMPAVAISATLLATTASRRWLTWAILVLALIPLRETLLRDPNKPVVPDRTETQVFALDRLDQLSLDVGDDIVPAARRLDATIGQRAALGIVGQDQLTDYLLYGEPLERRVVYFDPDEITPRAIAAAHVRGVFVGFANLDPCFKRCVAPRRGLSAIRLAGSAYLIAPASGRH